MGLTTILTTTWVGPRNPRKRKILIFKEIGVCGRPLDTLPMSGGQRAMSSCHVPLTVMILPITDDLVRVKRGSLGLIPSWHSVLIVTVVRGTRQV
jgi:hypothetical protein